MSIRPLQKRDIPSLSEMIKKEWDDSTSDFKREVNESFYMENRKFFVYCINKQVKGLVGISISEISYELWGITWLLVDESDRFIGIGSELVGFAEIFAAKNSFLKICQIQLTTSIPKFYKKLGYKKIEKWKDDKGEKRFLMFKRVKASKRMEQPL
jgi:predicted N-acetyltransferase YhbS